jgi:plasmid stabilization system protein ParE
VTDLHEIHDYIARDSRRYARATVEKITAATAMLADWPESGEVLHEFPEYRQIVVGKYRLIYREDAGNDRLLIIGVIHGARDFPPILRTRQGRDVGVRGEPFS